MSIKVGNTEVVLRDLEEKDLPFLAEYANNEKISNNLRDAFPIPYTIEDARNFYNLVKDEKPKTNFAIEFQGKYVGNIGLVIGTDVYRNSAELGFFIGEPFWNKGIVSKAVDLMVKYGFDELNLVRIFSIVFDYNKASQRVLEKCGFVKETVFRKSITKHGNIYDEVRYAKVKM